MPTYEKRLERLEHCWKRRLPQPQPESPPQPLTPLEELCEIYRRQLAKSSHAETVEPAAGDIDYMRTVRLLELPEVYEPIQEAARRIREEEEREHPPAAPRATREPQTVQETHLTGDASDLRPVFRLRNPPQRRE